MPLFISNSKIGLVIPSLLIFGFLFTGYNLGLWYFQPGVNNYQNQWQQNQAVAEEYLHVGIGQDVVIVGSSMAARMDNSMLGKGYFNLSFAAGSSLTGLEIIKRKKVLPKLVLIEANRLMSIDSGFVSDQFNSLSYFFKEFLPACRVKNQPINLLVDRLKKISGEQDASPDANTLARLVEIQKEAARILPDSLVLKKNIDNLGEILSFLSSQKVSFIFFTMPTHPQLVHSALAEAFRVRLRNAFPDSSFQWLGQIPGDFSTSDGIHLINSSARTFARILQDSVTARTSREDLSRL